MSRSRLLVIDADMPKRLAHAVDYRNRRAVSAEKLKLAQGVKDAALLRALAAMFNGKKDWVLVTGDDSQQQEPQSVRRYTINGSKVWTPRRRHVAEMARMGWTPWTPERGPDDAEPPPPPEPPPLSLWEQE